MKLGKGDRVGAVEFAHKSFGEFLFAERIKCAFEDWVEVNREKTNWDGVKGLDTARNLPDALKQRLSLTK